MKKKQLFDLQLFTDGDDGGTGTGAGAVGNGDGGQKAGAGTTGSGGGYSFEQAEEIANARAERASKAALASYFKQQEIFNMFQHFIHAYSTAIYCVERVG